MSVLAKLKNLELDQVRPVDTDNLKFVCIDLQSLSGKYSRYIAFGIIWTFSFYLFYPRLTSKILLWSSPQTHFKFFLNSHPKMKRDRMWISLFLLTVFYICPWLSHFTFCNRTWTWPQGPGREHVHCNMRFIAIFASLGLSFICALDLLHANSLQNISSLFSLFCWHGKIYLRSLNAPSICPENHNLTLRSHLSKIYYNC